MIQAAAWFEVNDLYPYIDGSASCNDPTEWASQNRKTKAYLIMMMGPDLVQFAQRAGNAAETWGKIKARCEPEGALVKAVLQRNLEAMKLNVGNEIPSFINKHDDLVARLAKVGTVYSEDALGTMLLSALDLDDPRFAPLFHSATLNEQGTMRPKCTNCRRPGHTLQQCYREGGGSAGQGPRQIKAKAAKEDRGRTPDGDQNKERDRARAKVEQLQANLAQAMEQLDLVDAASDETVSEFLDYPEACAACAMSARKESTTEWTADSACTHHISRDRPQRSSRLTPPHRIGLAGKGQSMPAVATGSDSIEQDKERIPLTAVYHVPDASHNLLSLPRIADDDFTIVLQKAGGKITKGMTQSQYEALDGVELRREGPYWKTGGKPPLETNAHAMATTAASLLDLHRILGHASRSRLIELVRKDLALGLQGAITLDDRLDCDACEMAKSHRQPFPSGTKACRETQPLALVHMDLAGPFHPSIGERYRYYLVIVDDASRYVWVSFLRSKSDTAAAIRCFRPYAEKRFDTKIKTLRTDRGGEFLDKSLGT
ncbi:hypothetical protein JCM1840_007168 [Sporobolomyces johnsonii]